MAIIKSPIFKDITESEISEMTAAGYSAHHLRQSEKGFLYICPMSQEKLAVRNS